MTNSKPTSVSPTDEQQDIVSAAKTSSSLMIRAYAGCAKTTTLELASRQIKQPALALAFNKSIVTELTGRLPSHFTIKSLNGLGHGAWLRANPAVQVKLDDKKIGRLVTETSKDLKQPLDSDQWDQTRRLVSGAMGAGLVPNDQGEPLLPDTQDNWADLADSLWIPKADFEYIYDLARRVLEQSIAQARQGVISFDDQIYCSVCLGGRFPQFPVLFVDEAQDLSPLNHAMIWKSVREDGKLVVCGDPKQAIYGFRGADSFSMDSMEGLSKSWEHLPLTLTFRCPKVVVERQQEHAPGYRAAEGNRDGRLSRFRAEDDQEEQYSWTKADLISLTPADQSLAVLCRNNSPLLSLAFKLLRQGVTVCMLGRDIGKGLVTLSRKIAKEDLTPRDTFLGLLEAWESKERLNAHLAGHDSKVASIADKAECLRAVAEFANAKDAGELRSALENLFSRTSGRVTLSSIHKAKGLEWDVVMVLDPWRIPSKHAKLMAKAGDERQLLQEYNLKYVAETRTKDVLVLANLDDFQ